MYHDHCHCITTFLIRNTECKCVMMDFVAQITLFVSSSDAVQPGWLVKYLREIDAKRIKEMQSNIVEVSIYHFFCSMSSIDSILMSNKLVVIYLQYSRHFLYSSPAQPLGPEDLTWRMVILLILL
jgi:hypothetical protein